MSKTRIAICVISLLFAIAVLSSGTAQGYHIGVTWGSNYHPIADPLYYRWENYEEPCMNYVAGEISDLMGAESGWASNNFYGAMTTGSNVYDKSDYIESGGSYDYLATFHVGDMYPDAQTGGYWEWNGWWYEWVETGPTRHYAYYGGIEEDEGLEEALPGVQDWLLYPHTGSKHRFTFIWTCANGGLIDLNGDGTYDFYGYRHI